MTLADQSVLGEITLRKVDPLYLLVIETNVGLIAVRRRHLCLELNVWSILALRASLCTAWVELSTDPNSCTIAILRMHQRQ